MADLPEISSLYASGSVCFFFQIYFPKKLSVAFGSDALSPTSFADLHWQIVKELREGPKAAASRPSSYKEPVVEKYQTNDMASSPFPTPRRSPRKDDIRKSHSDDEKYDAQLGDRLTKEVFSSMDRHASPEMSEIFIT